MDEAKEKPTYKRVVVRTPVGDFHRTTSKQTFAALSIYRVTKSPLCKQGVWLKPGDLWAVWHADSSAAENAPLRQAHSDLVGQYFVDTKQWEPITPLEL